MKGSSCLFSGRLQGFNSRHLQKGCLCIVFFSVPFVSTCSSVWAGAAPFPYSYCSLIIKKMNFKKPRQSRFQRKLKKKKKSISTIVGAGSLESWLGLFSPNRTAVPPTTALCSSPAASSARYAFAGGTVQVPDFLRFSGLSTERPASRETPQSQARWDSGHPSSFTVRIASHRKGNMI